MRRSAFQWVWLLIFCTASALAQEEPKEELPELPVLSDLPAPTREDLLLKPPVDWVVLKESLEVVICQPIFPRPDTLKRMAEAVKEAESWPRPATKEDQEEQRKKKDDLNYLNLSMVGQVENPEYRLHMKYVDRIIYHEDMILQVVDQMIKDGQMREAYEMLYSLDRNAPNWPGSAERQQGLLLRQADLKMEQQKPEAALVFLEDLHQRNKAFPGLQDALGRVIGSMIADSTQANQYRRARHFLARLAKLEPQHPVVTKWRGDFLAQAQKLIAEANGLAESGKHVDAMARIDAATHVWPSAPGLKNRHLQLGNRWQILRVGVIELPNEPGAWPLSTDADRRHQQLTEMPLFEIDYLDRSPHYSSRFFEEWVPADLGREMVFHLRREVAPWESRLELTSTDIVNTLLKRVDPEHPDYDERLASYIANITVQSPWQFTVRFTRVPLQPEALFAFPVKQYTLDENGQETSTLLSRRFELVEQGPTRNVYRRVIPQKDGLPDDNYHTAEIVEFKFPSHEEALQALVRGEVSLLPHVEPWIADQINKVNPTDFKAGRYAVPVTHLLQVNPESKPLKALELRRALSYGANRERLLREVVLRDPASKSGRVTNGPFPSRSYARESLEMPAYDLSTAFALSFAARQQLKIKKEEKLPVLKMICEPDPVVEAAAVELVKDWARIGITVELVDRNAATPRDWDLLYRKERMAEPLTELWPFLLRQEKAAVQSLAFLPDWFRRELINLDNAGDWTTAQQSLWRLHRYVVRSGEVIPLWELDDYFVYRVTNVTRFTRRDFQNTQTAPMHTYQDVERWSLKPWYELDPY